MGNVSLKYRAASVFLKTFISVRWGMRFKSRAAVLAYQNKMMAQHRQKWWHKTAFYAPYAHNPDNVPAMNKHNMMANFDALNTVGVLQKDCFELARAAEDSRDFSSMINGVTVGLSSGTSGIKGIFLASQIEQARWAAIMLAKLLPQPFYRSQRIALFLRANSNLYEKLDQSRWVQFKFFDLSLPIADVISALNEFSPTILVAPAQCLELLSKAQSKGELEIKPHKIIAVAEALPDDVREKVEHTWHTRVDEIYQATEGFLAVSCAYGQLHLNEEFVKFTPDWLDEEHTRFAPIITDFTRSSQLMVSYRLDDVLQLAASQTCACGSHTLIIDKIEGRCDDVLNFKKLNGDVLAVFPDAISRGILLVDGIQDFRVVQVNEMQVNITYTASNSVVSHQNAIQQAVQQALIRAGTDIQNLKINVTQVDAFEINLMHKRRRIVGLQARKI